MQLFNTLDRKIEELTFGDRATTMYTCGPTVYDVAHIGNLRKYVCDDVLFRTLKQKGEVKRVMNITDVDDKTINKSEGDKKKFEELTKKYEESFFQDLDKLNIIKPTVITRATQYIDQIVEFVSDLIEQGFAYKAADGSVYFSIDKFPDYGKLSNLEGREIKVGARVSSDEYDKDNPSDFALWKAWDEQDGEIYWETKLGKGRPGWHIECSAMSMAELGETIDIHTGGVDNIFPHHENEIAQSEARSKKKFVNFWVHNEHLLVDGKKMSKSLGNVYNLGDLEEKVFSPLDFRYFVIGAHYRSKLNFTWEGLESAKNTRERLANLLTSARPGEINDKYLEQFNSLVENDLNLPQALAVLWSMMRDPEVSIESKKATVLEMDKILGLGLGQVEEEENIPEEVLSLAKEREEARLHKDFKKSDTLREKISELGYVVLDTSDGFRVNKK